MPGVVGPLLLCRAAAVGVVRSAVIGAVHGDEGGDILACGAIRGVVVVLHGLPSKEFLLVVGFPVGYRCAWKKGTQIGKWVVRTCGRHRSGLPRRRNGELSGLGTVCRSMDSRPNSGDDLLNIGGLLYELVGGVRGGSGELAMKAIGELFVN